MYSGTSVLVVSNRVCCGVYDCMALYFNRILAIIYRTIPLVTICSTSTRLYRWPFVPCCAVFSIDNIITYFKQQQIPHYTAAFDAGNIIQHHHELHKWSGFDLPIRTRTRVGAKTIHSTVMVRFKASPSYHSNNLRY